MCPSSVARPKLAFSPLDAVQWCRVDMPQGCYSCTLEWFEDAQSCHWVYLNEAEDAELLNAGKSKGLVVYRDGANKQTYAPLCNKCVAWHLTRIRLHAAKPEQLTDIMADTMTKAVIEYIGDQVVAGKLLGGYK